MEDKILKTCPECGEPSIVSRDGKEVHKRCACDWERGFISRVARTVHREFWEDRVLNMADWRPSLFNKDNAGLFRNLIRVQKAETIRAVYDFAYDITSMGKDGSLRFSVEDSLAKGRNLFVRGPQGSGRGLLLAAIKMLCAMRGISTTPLPDDFAVCKSKVIEAEAFGKEGEEAKAAVDTCYANVALLVLQDVHGEYRTNFSSKEKVPVRSRGANGIDTLLARRLGKRGSLAMTSSEFAGQIGDTLGDKMMDILDSDKTRIATMFSPIEAEQFLHTLRDRHKMFDSQADGLTGDEKKGRKTQEEQMGEDQLAESIKEGFYFSEAFPKIPNLGKERPDRDGREPEDSDFKLPIFDLHEGAINDGECPKYARKALEEFVREREQGSHDYRENLRYARLNAVRACSISARMSEREMESVGRMLSDATSGPDRVKEIVTGAIDIMHRMGGRGDS